MPGIGARRQQARCWMQTIDNYSPLLTGYCMESQIGYIQIQIHLWVTSRIPKIGFQNPRLPFSRKKTALSTPGFYRRASRILNLASRIPDCHFSKKTALSTPRFYRRAPRTRDCHFFIKNTALSTPGFYRKTSRYHILPRYHIFTFVIHVQIISQNIRFSNMSHDLIGGQ